MRDPDLVQRAERAALALERAWDRWRTMHGFGDDPLPPVSSYVGYSLEEPWGQPRVVFGVAADEAELLASLLDGHDCVGPVHHELTGSVEWRRGSVDHRGRSPWPLPAQLSIPQQAPQPGSDMFLTASHGDPLDHAASAVAMTGADGLRPDSIDWPPAVGNPVATDPAAAVAASDASLVEDAPREGPGRPRPGAATSANGKASAPRSAASRRPRSPKTPAVPPVQTAATGHLGDAHELADGVQPGHQAVRAESGQAESGAAEPRQAQPGQPDANAQPEIVAFRPRPEQSPGAPPEAEPAPEQLTSSDDLMPNQGPGYRGPRYQGYPPQYQEATGPAKRSSAYAAAPVADSDLQAPARKPLRSKARQVTKLGRSRQQGPGAHEAWGSEGDQAATDHAV
jgi:hypothetical protein